MSFVLNRSLLNPKFDGYKLSTLDHARSVTPITLPARGISQSTVPASGRMSFHEVQSRVRWNHLALGCDSAPSNGYATLGYIDKEGVFTAILINKVRLILSSHSICLNSLSNSQQTSLETQFYSLFEIPQEIQASTSEREYPAAISLSTDIWVLSDGSGRMYVIRTSSPPASAALLSSAEITFNNALVSCRLHSAVLQDNYIVLLISSRGETTRTSTRKIPISFELAALRVPISSSSQDPVQAELLWRKQGSDIPSYVNAQAGNFLVCASGTFSDSALPAPDQMESARNSLNTDTQPTTKPPPYSWTQTSESLTVAFPLPSNTPKSHIHVTIGPKHLSVLIKDIITIDDSDDEKESSFPFPKYAMKELWDQVDRDSSVWTWDKEGERTVGLLTLHLEKKYEGTKWPHVFAREGSSSNDPEVPETVDPSEMYKIREALEKYTADLQNGDGGGELPSLAQGEMDPTVDTEVGRKATVSYFDILTGEELAPNSSYHEILSFPLPIPQYLDGQDEDSQEEVMVTRSLTIKTGIDGPLFTAPILPQADTWTHISTFPALAFVLASKRDTRFIFHVRPFLLPISLLDSN
jgi:hypothetical protein